MGRLLTPTGDARHDQVPFQMTLLELITLLFDITNDEEEAMTMAFELVVTGEVCLIGSLRGESLEWSN